MDNEQNSSSERGSRKIYRSRTDRIVFGVCGGIADYYNIESLWIRVVFIFLGITGAIGFLLYLALALLMPLDPEGTGVATKNLNVHDAALRIKTGAKQLRSELAADTHGRAGRRSLLGLLIVIIGIVAFFNALFPGFPIGWNLLWPAIIILIGLSFISK